MARFTVVFEFDEGAKYNPAEWDWNGVAELARERQKVVLQQLSIRSGRRLKLVAAYVNSTGEQVYGESTAGH